MKPKMPIKLHQASLILGRRYRINEQGNKADGRCGTLESVIDGEAWLKVAGFGLVRAPADCLTDSNVVQVDLTPLRTRREAPLVWADFEQFA